MGYSLIKGHNLNSTAQADCALFASCGRGDFETAYYTNVALHAFMMDDRRI